MFAPYVSQTGKTVTKALLILDAADGSGEDDAATLREAVREVQAHERRSWRASGMNRTNLDPEELAWREQMERRLREGPR